MRFNDVIGQLEVKDHLVQMVEHNRLSHALLFLGKEGAGALPLALAFAQYIVCTDAATETIETSDLFSIAAEFQKQVNEKASDSCGICPACIKSNKLIHPDIHYSYPVFPKKPGDKPISIDYIENWREFIFKNPYGNVYDWLQFIGAENKQGNITAEECNSILKKLSLKSFESRFKILIMWMPEFLGKEGNKLLKLIEEPPDDTIFIFVAEDEKMILPTILSRTQLITIPALKDSDIEEKLNLIIDNHERVHQIASISEGNYREALKLSAHAEDNWQLLLRDWLNAIIRSGPIAQVKWIEEMSKVGREKQKQFLRYFIHLLDQAIRIRLINHEQLNSVSDAIKVPIDTKVQSTNAQEFLTFSSDLKELHINMSDSESDFAGRLNKMSTLSAQQAIIEELDKAIYYIERNANAKMLFHALSIRLSHIVKDNSVILIH